MLNQRTISREVSLAGPGLFSGESATLTFAPADVGSGVNFLRQQDDRVATIPARVSNVLKRPRRTCLKNGTLHVETVEHCLAALAGMGVDNVVVRLAGGTTGELPAGDGSSKPFVDVIQDAGIVEQDEPVQPLVIKRPVQVNLGDTTLAALPGPTDRLEIIYDFEAPPRSADRRSASTSGTTTSCTSSRPRARSCSTTRPMSCAPAGWVSICRQKICS